jgi:hypothetical protein
MDWDTYFIGPAGVKEQQTAGPDWDNYFGASKEEAAPQPAAQAASKPDPMAAMPEWIQTAHKAIGPDWGTALTLGSMGVRGPKGSVLPNRVPEAAPKVASNTQYATKEQLKDMSQGLYQEAKEAGVEYTSQGYNRLVAGLEHKLASEGVRKDLHPDTFHAITEMIKTGKSNGAVPGGRNIGLNELDQLRQVASKARRKFGESSNDADKRLSKIVTDRIDDFINTPGPGAVAAGDPAKAANAIRNGRALWQRMRKAETLDKIHERALNKVGANYSNAGMQTALRQEFRNLANSPKFSRFSKEEQALVKRIIGRGANMENILRWAGKFAPTSPISAMVSMFVGAPGGVVGQAALMGAGTVARNASARMGANKVNELNALVRRGYTEGGASY